MADNEVENCNVLVKSDIEEAYRRLDELDEQERKRWRTALIILGMLGLMVIALSMASAPQHWMWSMIVLCLAIALAATFLLVAVRPQMLMIQSRRELASQLGVVAALESLRLITGDSTAAKVERRRLSRANCDLSLAVVVHEDNYERTYYGRVRDICEHGMGAIVPAALTVGENVKLSFTIDEKTAMSLQGTVRQRNGFRYGFEFSELTARECEVVERLWLEGAPEHSAGEAAGN